MVFDRVLTGLASMCWLALSGVTAIGGLREPASLPGVNMAMAAVFAGIAAWLAWRLAAMEAVRRCHPDCRQVGRLIAADAVAAGTALLLGLACLSAAVFRVWIEMLPVFG